MPLPRESRPLLPGSGNCGTPWERMQAAYATALLGPDTGADADREAVDPTLATPGDDEPPQPASNAAVRTAVVQAAALRCRGGLFEIHLIECTSPPLAVVCA